MDKHEPLPAPVLSCEASYEIAARVRKGRHMTPISNNDSLSGDARPGSGEPAVFHQEHTIFTLHAAVGGSVEPMCHSDDAAPGIVA